MSQSDNTPLSALDIELAMCAAAAPHRPSEPSDEDLVLYVLGALDGKQEAEVLAAARDARTRRRLTDVADEVESLLSRSLEDLDAASSPVAELLSKHAAAALRVGLKLPSHEPAWCTFHEEHATMPDALALLAALVNVEKLETPYFEVAQRSAQPIAWTEDSEWTVKAQIDDIGSLIVDVRVHGGQNPSVKRLRLVFRHQGIRLPLGVADLYEGHAQLRAVGVARLLGLKKGQIDPDAIMVLPCENQTATRVLYTNETDLEVAPFATVVAEPTISNGFFEITLKPIDLSLGSIVEVAIPVSHRGCWQRLAASKWNGSGVIRLLSKLPWEYEEGTYAGVLRLRRLSG